MALTEGDKVDQQRTADTLRRIALTVGLGLCWASEELVTFRVGGLPLEDGSVYLYGAYLPLLALFGTLLALVPSLGKLLERDMAPMVALLLGVFGVLVLALFPHEGLAVVSGVAFYTAGAAAVNVLWMRQFVFSGVREVRRAIVATAVATSVLLPLWWLPDAGALLAAAILFVLSAGAYGLVDKGEMPRHESTCVDAPSMGRGEMRRWAAPAGVCVLMMGFGFAQYTAYHYGLPETNPISWEVFSHILAIVLLAGAVYGARDGELTFGFKMATTLMLFSFVLLAVLWPSIGASAALAAATDGMLELVLLLALVEYVSARGLPPIRAFGGYLAFVAGTQLVGCALSVLDHAFLPPASYSVVGLVLVGLLIVAAVWLLNDKTITAFLWEGQEKRERGAEANACAGRPSGSGDATKPISFDERAAAVAAAFRLTARESEIMALFAKGRSSSFIAEMFCVSNNTVRSHILHLYAKCDVHSRQELITLIDEWEPAS